MDSPDETDDRRGLGGLVKRGRGVALQGRLPLVAINGWGVQVPRPSVQDPSDATFPQVTSLENRRFVRIGHSCVETPH